MAGSFVPLVYAAGRPKVGMGTASLDVRKVDAGGHPVVIGPDALRVLDQEIGSASTASAFFILGDTNTLRHCLPELLAHVPTLREASTIAVPPGEPSKSLAVCQDIWRHLMDSEADRKCHLINLGGGVISDLGGFIAATYKRGITFHNVPTSVMGMVDASIGGKTGIDLFGVKNMVGAFHDPAAAYIHPMFLKSLGKRELMNGVAEMVKHGLVQDAKHWDAVRTAPLQDLGTLALLIEHSAEIKAGIVKRDPREHDQRKVLNFGHTIGHGIEAHSWESPHRSLLHGEAVVAGMVCETWLSWRTGSLDRGAHDQVVEHLLDLYPTYRMESSDPHRIIALMRNDKKNSEGSFRFSLLTDIGEAKVDVAISAAQIQEALEHYRSLVKGHSRKA